MEKVIAVVVTYNRLTLLKECISALRNQSYKLASILVVNNNSSDGTEEWLQQQRDIQVISQENVGGAGGFSRAIQSGYEGGFEWIWCMDDDGLPKEDALEKLLSIENKNLQLLNCAVINKEDKRSFVWKTGNYRHIDEVNTKVIKGVGHPFNGTLINRRIVERVGVPKSRLFIWGDETEYYYRITSKNQIPVVTVTESIHYHPPTTFSIRKNWDHTTTWKLYFYLRNRFQINRSRFNSKILAFLGYACFIAGFALYVLMYQKTDKIKKLHFILWPMKDAILDNYAATPSDIMKRLNARPTKNTTSIFSSVKSLYNGLPLRIRPNQKTATA